MLCVCVGAGPGGARCSGKEEGQGRAARESGIRARGAREPEEGENLKGAAPGPPRAHEPRRLQARETGATPAAATTTGHQGRSYGPEGHAPPGAGIPAAVRAALLWRPGPRSRSRAPVGMACLSLAPCPHGPLLCPRGRARACAYVCVVRCVVCSRRLPGKRGRTRPGPSVSLCAPVGGRRTRDRGDEPLWDRIPDPLLRRG